MRTNRCHYLVPFLIAVAVPVTLSGVAHAQTYSRDQLLPPPSTSPPQPTVVGLTELIERGLARNPRLSQASLAIDSARGRALQAGLYPNPALAFNLDELGDKTGPGGVNTLPLVTQEIVTGGKLRLSQAAANKEVDQATLALMSERYAFLAHIRAAYFDVISLQRRIAILNDLVKLATVTVDQSKRLLKGDEIARRDLIQLEVERERLLADLEAAERELPAVRRRLAAIMGEPSLTFSNISGTLDQELPAYELDKLQRFIIENHPDRQSAVVGITKAQLQLDREKVEPYPNVTVGAGYVRQNQNRSNDWTLNVSMPLPVWNRNQGKISSAVAALGTAQLEVERVENELVERVSTAFRDYAAPRQRVERYRTGILPKAKEAYELSVKAYQGGVVEYLRVLDSQRAYVQANLEYVRAQGDAWKAASYISGLALEDEWPRLIPDFSTGKIKDNQAPQNK